MASTSKSDSTEDDCEDKAEVANYSSKMEEMQKYIPFLEVMIARIEKAKDKSREAQLLKLKSLYEILSSKKQKLKAGSLEKCELLLKKLYEKVEKGDKVAVNEKVPDSSKNTSLTNKLDNTSCKTIKRPKDCTTVKIDIDSSVKDNVQKESDTELNTKPQVAINNQERNLMAKPKQDHQLLAAIDKLNKYDCSEIVKPTLGNQKVANGVLQSSQNPSVSNYIQPLKTDSNLDKSLLRGVGGKQNFGNTNESKIRTPNEPLPIFTQSRASNAPQAKVMGEGVEKSMQNTLKSPALSLRAKLAEEISTVHKVGTSSGGALRGLVNKAENIKNNRILSLKPGTVIDLFNEKPVSSVNPNSVDSSSKGKFDQPKRTSKYASDNFKPISQQTSSDSPSNVLSHLTSEQLEKLVSDNLELLPSPPAETMMKILETVSASTRNKPMSSFSSSVPAQENVSFNQGPTFSHLTGPISPQLPLNTVQVPICTTSPSHLGDSMLKTNRNYSHDQTSHLQGQHQQHYGGYTPNHSSVGQLPGSGGMGYCHSPYPQRNDSVPHLLTPPTRPPLYIPSLLPPPPFPPEVAMSPRHEPVYFQPNKPDYQSLSSAQNRHFSNSSRNYSVLSTLQSPSSGPFDNTKSAGKVLSDRDPRRRSLEVLEDNERSQRKSSEMSYDDKRDPRFRNVERPYEDIKRMTKDESNFAADNKKQNDFRSGILEKPIVEDDKMKSREQIDNSLDCFRRNDSRHQNVEFRSGALDKPYIEDKLKQSERNDCTTESFRRIDPRQQRQPPAPSRDHTKTVNDQWRKPDYQNDLERRNTMMRARDPRYSGDRRFWNQERSQYSRDKYGYESDRYRKSNDSFNFDRSKESVKDSFNFDKGRESFKKEEFSSPLDQLYSGVSGPKTGKGYGFQSFRIPKKKKDPEPVKTKTNDQTSNDNKTSEPVKEGSNTGDQTSDIKQNNEISSGNADDVDVKPELMTDTELGKDEPDGISNETTSTEPDKSVSANESKSNDDYLDSNQQVHESKDIELSSDLEPDVKQVAKDDVKHTKQNIETKVIVNQSELLKQVDTKQCDEKNEEKTEKQSDKEKESTELEKIEVESKEAMKDEKVTEVKQEALDVEATKSAGKEQSKIVEFADSIKDEFTQEIIETYLRKSLTSGLCKKLLEKLGGAPLRGEKLKKIQKIIVSSSEEEDDDAENENSKTDNDKTVGKKAGAYTSKNSQSKTVEVKEEPNEQGYFEQSNDDSCDVTNAEAEISETEENTGQPKRQTRSSRTKVMSPKKPNNSKKSSATKAKSTKPKTRSSSKSKSTVVNEIDSETVDCELNSDKPKRKNELEKLHEDIRDMFISASVVNATGMRTCRLKPDNASNESLQKKGENDSLITADVTRSRKSQSKGKKTRSAVQSAEHESTSCEESEEDMSVKSTAKIPKKLNKSCGKSKEQLVESDGISAEENVVECLVKSKKKSQTKRSKAKNHAVEAANEASSEDEPEEHTIKCKTKIQPKRGGKTKIQPVKNVEEDSTDDDNNVLDEKTSKPKKKLQNKPSVKCANQAVITSGDDSVDNSQDFCNAKKKVQPKTGKNKIAKNCDAEKEGSESEANADITAKKNLAINTKKGKINEEKESELNIKDEPSEVVGSTVKEDTNDKSSEDEALIVIKNKCLSKTSKKDDTVEEVLIKKEVNDDISLISENCKNSDSNSSTPSIILEKTAGTEDVSSAEVSAEKLSPTKKCEIVIDKLVNTSSEEDTEKKDAPSEEPINQGSDDKSLTPGDQLSLVQSDCKEQLSDANEIESIGGENKRKIASSNTARKKMKFDKNLWDETPLSSVVEKVVDNSDEKYGSPDVDQVLVKIETNKNAKDILPDESNISEECATNKTDKIINAVEVSEVDPCKQEKEEILAKTEVSYTDKDYSQDPNFVFKVLSCKLCDFSAKSVILVRHYLTEHENVEVLISRFSPSIADEALQQSDALQWLPDACDTAKKNLKLSYCCRMCKKVCTNTLSFYDHVAGHTGEYRHQCLSCFFKASNRDAIKTHCQKAHYQHMPSKKIEYNKIIQAELIADLQYEVLGYLCTECNFVQLKIENVEKHFKKRHVGCDIKTCIKKINFSSEINALGVEEIIKMNAVKPSEKSVIPETIDKNSSCKDKVCVVEVNPEDRIKHIKAFISSEEVQDQADENVEEKVGIMKDVANKLKGVNKLGQTGNDSLEKLTSKLLSNENKSNNQELNSSVSTKICVKEKPVYHESSKESGKIKVPQDSASGVESCSENPDEPLSKPSEESESLLNRTDIIQPPSEGVKSVNKPIERVISEDSSLKSDGSANSGVSEKLIDNMIRVNDLEFQKSNYESDPHQSAYTYKDPLILKTSKLGNKKSMNNYLNVVDKLSESLSADDYLQSTGAYLGASSSSDSILLGILKSSCQSNLKKYKFQDNNVTCIRVGYLSAVSELGIIYFLCNVEGCDFKKTSSADSLLQHVEEVHENCTFEAVCTACFMKCDKNNESHMVSSFMHLLNNHLVLHTGDTAHTSQSSNSDLSGMLGEQTNNSPSEIKSQKEVPARPLLRVRRLSGDKLSSGPAVASEEITINNLLATSVSPYGGEDDAFQNLRIESVVSLNPSACNSDNSDSVRNELSSSSPNSKSYVLVPSGNCMKVAKRVFKLPVSANNSLQLLPGLEQSTPGNPKRQTLVSLLSKNLPKVTGLSPNKSENIGLFSPLVSGINPSSSVLKCKSVTSSKIRKPLPQSSKNVQAIEKPLSAFNAMIEPRKLRHLFKCADSSCTFSTDSPKKFVVHCEVHKRSVLQKTANFESGGSDWRICLYCSETYTFPIDLCKHIIQEHSVSLYQCAFCFYRAISTANVTLHQNMNHIAQNIKIFKCAPFKTLGGREGLVVAPRQSTPRKCDVIRPYECSMSSCRLKTYIPAAYEKHLQTHIHLRISQTCIYCCIKIMKPENILEHYKIHSLNLYQCLYCLYGSDIEEDMRVHLCVEHPDYTPKAVMRVDKNLCQESLELEESSFTTNLEDLKECNFDDQIIDSCIIYADTQMDDHDELISIPSSSCGTPVTIPDNNNDKVQMLTPSQDTVDSPSNPSCYTRVIDPGKILFFDAYRSGYMPSNIPGDSGEGNDVEIVDSQLKRPSDTIVEGIEPPKKKQLVSVETENIENAMPISQRSVSTDEDVIMGRDENRQLSVENLYTCGYSGCGYVARDSDGLKEHFKVCDFQRDTSKSVKCVHCGKFFKRVTSLMDHLPLHGDKRFRCSLCEHKETTEKRANAHMKDVHNVANLKIIPLDPLRTNKDSDTFVVLPLDTKASRFSLLDMKGRAKKVLQSVNYISEIDQLPKKEIFTKPAQCSRCSYSTKVRKNMAQHLKCHEKGGCAPSNEYVNPMPCLENKEMMFDKMINLAGSTHMKSAMKPKSGDLSEQNDLPKYVPDNQRYVCHATGCAYVTVDDIMLRHHIKALHCDEITYRCPHCKNNNNLDIPVEKLGIHLKLHDIRLYKCAHCIYHHNQRYLVERHVSEKHPEKRPFVQVVREPEGDDGKGGLTDERGEGFRTSNFPDASTFNAKQWLCNLCKFRTFTEIQIKDHSGSAHGAFCRFKCGLCNFKADISVDVSDHFSSQHSPLPLKVICMYSKEDEQLSFVVPVNDKTNTCDTNSHKYTAPLWRKDKKRVRHIRGILLDDQPWKPRQNKENKTVAHELLLEEGKYGPFGYPSPGGYYTCPKCNKYKTKNKNDMQNHLYRELEYKLWVCGYCRKADITRYCINRHLAKIHEGKPESVTVRTPNDEIESWVNMVSHVLKRQHFLMKMKDMMVEESPVKSSRPSTSAYASSGNRSRRSSVVDEEINVEDFLSKDVIESSPKLTKDEASRSLSKQAAQQMTKQLFFRKLDFESTTDEESSSSSSTKQLKGRKQMLHKRWVCGYCSVTTVQERSMKAHLLKKHPNFLPLMHSIVDPRTLAPIVGPTPDSADNSSVQDSASEEEDGYSDIFECRLCGLIGTMKELYVHNYNAHPHNKQAQVTFKEGKRFECRETDCTYVTQSFLSLKEHFRWQHANKKLYYDVKLLVKPNSAPEAPSKTDDSITTNKKYICPTCDFSSNVQSDIIFHLKSHLLYKCTICSTVFSSAITGKNHIKEIHNLPYSEHLKPILSSDLVTKGSPPVKVIYTARKSTAMGPRCLFKRQTARKSTSRLPNSWKDKLNLNDRWDSSVLSIREFSFYGKPRTVENFNAIKTSLVLANQSMNLTVTQFSKIVDINAMVSVTDLKYTNPDILDDRS